MSLCNIFVGLQPGAKPPSISTMMSPAASKLSRNTATVPPLNQVSPSNGVTSVSASSAMSATRTASFAAALRKLAHQAKDPGNRMTYFVMVAESFNSCIDAIVFLIDDLINLINVH